MCDRDKFITMVIELYHQGKIDKDILKSLVDTIPNYCCLMYLTPEEYSNITGEKLDTD